MRGLAGTARKTYEMVLPGLQGQTWKEVNIDFDAGTAEGLGYMGNLGPNFTRDAITIR